MGILRGVEQKVITALIEAIIESGLKTIEITMNTRNACGLIKEAARVSCGRLTIGAGTVLELATLKEALSSGATFCVTPVLVKEVSLYCQKNKIPIFPGALTPLEIYNAWSLGAAMVKVFPAKFFGPDYFKEIKGPFGDIELLACGGVNPHNIKEYFNKGAAAVAFGASVFRKEWIQENDFASVAKCIKDLISAMN